jgi:arabinoxylan arabinofuranohydrolase
MYMNQIMDKTMKKLLLFFAGLVFSVKLYPQNPIVPPGIYIADPAAHVWKDGKLYVYGSLDESTEYYCSWRHHVLVTEDLKNWRILEDRFASRGNNDQVSYNNSLLYAPDCMFRNGSYYLYFCQPDPQHAEGVATSADPAGPFVNGKPINIGRYNQIDPRTFVDDDGQAYYIWGQFTLKMGKLKPDMTELDESTIVDGVLTESQHFFHEGAFMTKREGVYYLVYADLSRANMPTCLGYATSKAPLGPYKYGGVIIDNDHCDPGNWNNHGSIAEFNGQWYVFYHRATHNSKMMRKACVEPITFLPDGRIPEVMMTSQGAGGPLPATEKIEAERACGLRGNVRIQLDGKDNEVLGQIYHDDSAVFRNIDFGSGVHSISMRIKPGNDSGILVLNLDMPWGLLIAKVQIPKRTAGNDNWITVTAPVENASGVHALWLAFWGDHQKRDLDWSVDWFSCL